MIYDNTVESNGFTLICHKVLKQKFAENFKEYVQKVSQRGLSDLTVLSDSEFKSGINRMSEVINRGVGSEPIFEPTDLFIFQRVE